jgi:hypothetical protein
VGDVQHNPLKVRALPASSTAAQNEELGHDNPKGMPALSMSEGDNHDDPLKVMASPEASRATQNEELGHDTVMGSSAVPMNACNHSDPLKV